MSYKVTGKIVHVGDVEEFGTNGFTKRTVVIETAEQYPQQIGFELHKDKTELIRPDDIGREIRASYNLRGREWNGKYFTNLVVWKVEFTDTANTETAQAELPPTENPDEDGLPF